MKIKKVDEKPMVLHTKKNPKLHIQTRNKADARKLKQLSGKEKSSNRKESKNDSKKDKKQSIKVCQHSLYSIGKAGAKELSEQIEGGEELQESVELLAAAAHPLCEAASKGEVLYRKEAEKKRDRKQKKQSRIQSELEHAQTEIKMRRSAKQKKSPKGTNKTETNGKTGIHGGSFVKSQMMQSFMDKVKTEKEDNQGGFVESTVKNAKRMLITAVQMLISAVAPYILICVAVVAIIGAIITSVLAVIYNSPFALFVPQPETGYENPRMVLSGYYKEFNEEIMRMEKDGNIITYQNTEDGAPISNFNDTLMVYMVKFGTGNTGFVMDDEGKKHLKEVFDEMNYYDCSSSTTKISAGESLGEVVTTGYCSCSICCGKWAGGHTASGTVPKGNHTLAVDAHHPKVPMGTKIVMNGHTYKVEDTGNFAQYGTDFDIYFDSHAEAVAWGKRKVKAYLAEGDSNTVEVTTSGTQVHNLTYQDYIAKNKLDDSQTDLLKNMMDSDMWDSYYDVAGGSAVAELAMTKIGCHYDQSKRMQEGYYDCSSLVYRLYKEAGINLPTVASTQGEYCYKNAMLINKKDLKPGDLIFYSYKKNGEFRNISHVAIYVGDGKMVHAANERRGVVLDPLRTNHVVFYARPY